MSDTPVSVCQSRELSDIKVNGSISWLFKRKYLE